MNAVTRNVQLSLADSPVSLRELARRCGVSHVQLARIVSGDRNATEAVAVAIADALDAIAKESAKAAFRVRRSLTTHLRDVE
jgi:transcriptional regulator with XRE-family HTH domain